MKVRFITGRVNDSHVYEISEETMSEFDHVRRTRMRTGQTTAFLAILKDMRGDRGPFDLVADDLRGWQVSDIRRDRDIYRVTLKPCRRGRPKKLGVRSENRTREGLFAAGFLNVFCILNGSIVYPRSERFRDFPSIYKNSGPGRTLTPRGYNFRQQPKSNKQKSISNGNRQF